jgi:hypothetical protein
MKNSKTLVAAATISAALATGLWAEAHFAFGDYLESSSVLDLGLITTDEAAVVEIYDFAGGEKGELLGSTDLRAGANPNVRVNVGIPPRQDVLAIVMVGDHAMSVKHFHVHD